jgi:hypothetical protein
MVPLDECDAVDLDALRRCVALTRAESAVRRQQIDDLLTREPWIEVAQHCAYRRQMKALGLPPWAQPPSTCGEEDAAANELLDKMLDADISQFEPDPIAALARAEAKARRR